jgi:lysine 2,3-aminomutase
MLADEPIVPLKPPVDPSALKHLQIRGGRFWEHVPAYKAVSDEQFLDHHWQAKHSITRPDKLLEVVRRLVSERFIKDIEEGFARAPMSLRVSPYLLSLIDWTDHHKDMWITQQAMERLSSSCRGNGAGHQERVKQLTFREVSYHVG